MRKILAILARSFGCAIAIVLALALSACAGPAHFSTVLDAPDGLGPGDPVTHGGTTIGTVTGVTPLATGDSQAAITINSGYSESVRVDSILILSGTGVGPSLELENRDLSSAYAPEGAVIYGASNQSQAQLFESSLGPTTIAKRYANLFAKMQATSPSPAASPGAGTPPNVLSQQLQQLTQQTLAAAAAVAATSPPSAAQMDDFRHDAAAVDRQLRAHGKNAEADQLQASVAQMNAAAPPGTPAGSGSPAAPANTLTVPPAVPATP
jgi:ABC-type transporter Mla subunit MlaD